MTENDRDDDQDESGRFIRRTRDVIAGGLRRVIDDLRSVPSPSQAADSPGAGPRPKRAAATDADQQTLEQFRQSFVDAVEEMQRELRGLRATGASMEVEQIITFVPSSLLGRIQILRDMPEDERAALATSWLRDIAGRQQKSFDLSGLQRWHIRTAERNGSSDALNPDELLPEFDFELMRGDITAAFNDATIRTHIKRRARFQQKGAAAADAPALDYELVDSATGQRLGRGTVSLYPCTLGREQADLRVPGCAKVSSTHIEILQHGTGLAVRHVGTTNPTWLIAGDDAQQIGTGQTMALPARGELALGVAGNEPGGARLRFRIGGDGIAAATGRGGTVFAADPAPGVRLSDAFGAPRPEPAGQARGAAETLVRPEPMRPAAPTRLAAELAWVVLRYHDGEEVRTPIERCPFPIGREPDPSDQRIGLRIREHCAHVSRRHLEIVVIDGGIATVQDHSKSGSFRADGSRLAARFALPLQASASRDGWISLGHPALIDTSVLMRIERPTGAG
jgi:hypothetical protein